MICPICQSADALECHIVNAEVCGDTIWICRACKTEARPLTELLQLKLEFEREKKRQINAHYGRIGLHGQ